LFDFFQHSKATILKEEINVIVRLLSFFFLERKGAEYYVRANNGGEKETDKKKREIFNEQ
jgi:hypothetical protein